ncbi:hypothetical protein H4R21_001818 [Coemansia helicoidea]|uniref:Uncharacterized protein n=1 Tax=Coemansia helicoidea TaxID=1286919 RepID=A0ACC1LA09_9FUNG|nr:hypothetical protein H4R21_001818 [Coemansia helicoidea]
MHGPRAPPASEDRPQLHVGTDRAATVSAPGEPEPRGPADSDEDGQYSRIQGMIDALIKDAGSALNSKPRDLRLSGRSGRTLHAATPGDSLLSSGLDETLTLVGDRSIECTPTATTAPKPRSAAQRPTHNAREIARHAQMPRPSSARGASPTVAHSWRQPPPRPSTRAAWHWTKPRHDPSEADAESDSDGGFFGAPALTPQHSRRPQSRRHRRLSSGQFGDWHAATAQTYGRRRADTGDSLPSNSSETCVSPGNRFSREFPPMSLAPPYVDLDDSRARTAENPHLFPLHPHCGSHYYGGYNDTAPLGHHRSVEGECLHPEPPFGRARSSTHGCDVSPVAPEPASVDGCAPGPPLGHPAGQHLGHGRTEAAAATATRLSLDAPESGSDARGRSLSVGRTAGPPCGGDSGLLSMVSLVYWTVLFTLGVLMLDSFLCQTAGKRVMGTVDRISHAGPADASQEDRQADGDGAGNLAGAVGRFVRWYVESPEDSSGASGAGTQSPRPSSLRVRKAAAARGSFQHIE